jgi:hypothetical protein
MFKYLLAIMLFNLYVWACPFDEAEIEVTIVAHKEIYSAALQGDFQKATEAIRQNEKLYLYFEQMSKSPLYENLLTASESKDVPQLKKLLDYSLELEIQELLEEVDANFTSYQKSKLLLIKAKKHLIALTKDKQARKYINKILRSIGNPGLMGVGKKEPNKKAFYEYKDKLLTYLHSLE